MRNLFLVIALAVFFNSTSFGQAPPSFRDLGNIGSEGEFEFKADATFIDIAHPLWDPFSPDFEDWHLNPDYDDLPLVISAGTALAIFDSGGNLLDGNDGSPNSQIIRNLPDGEFFICFSLEGAVFDDGFEVLPPIYVDENPDTHHFGLHPDSMRDFDNFNLSMNGGPLAQGGPGLYEPQNYGTSDFSAGFELLRVEVGSGIPALLGDVNGDGVVNFLDITEFVSVLSAGGFQGEADMDLNGTVDMMDIQPFIDALLGL